MFQFYRDLTDLYRSPKQNINLQISERLDFYSKRYENICILDIFNATTSNKHLRPFSEN